MSREPWRPGPPLLGLAAGWLALFAWSGMVTRPAGFLVPTLVVGLLVVLVGSGVRVLGPAAYVVAGVQALVGLLAFTLSPVVAPASADHYDGAPGPVHAGNTFGWYQFGVFRQEFVGPKPAFWKQRGRGIVRTQNGMLTLMSTQRGSVSATLDRHRAKYG